MSQRPYVMLAPIHLKSGVTEDELLAASDTFEASFVKKQRGILKRLLLRSKDGSYADLVFFANKAAADRVVVAEASSEECLEFFKIMEPADPNLPDMGVLSFEHIKAYE